MNPIYSSNKNVAHILWFTLLLYVLHEFSHPFSSVKIFSIKD